MQVNSLITPTEEFLKDMVYLTRNHDIWFTPRAPEKDGVYVCTNLYQLPEYPGMVFVHPDDIMCFFTNDKGSPEEVHVQVKFWKELQPPLEIDIEEIIYEPETII